MLNIITDLGKRSIKFQSLAEPWASTDNPAAELMLTEMAGIAQFERRCIRERQPRASERALRASLASARGNAPRTSASGPKRMSASTIDEVSSW
jgi:DNA invertase Pin-like site-specific DNA recombinase